MLGIEQNSKYFKVFKYIFFVVFLGLSVYFLYGVLETFFSGKTSISQSEVSIKELPWITLCFINFNSRIPKYEYWLNGRGARYEYVPTKYEYGPDFIIQYEILDTKLKNSSIFLIEGENAFIYGETVYLEKIIINQEGNCYNLTSILINNYMINQKIRITQYFNSSMNEKDLPTHMKIIVGSEKKTYFTVYTNWIDWRDGKLSGWEWDPRFSSWNLEFGFWNTTVTPHKLRSYFWRTILDNTGKKKSLSIDQE